MSCKDKAVPSWNAFGPISCVAAFGGSAAHQSSNPYLHRVVGLSVSPGHVMTLHQVSVSCGVHSSEFDKTFGSSLSLWWSSSWGWVQRKSPVCSNTEHHGALGTEFGSGLACLFDSMNWFPRKGCGVEFYAKHKNAVISISWSTFSMMWSSLAHFDPAE